jgi:long-subunit fatty acid transport protein
MGGAIGPIVDGPAAIYHNPAGLAQIDRMELNLTLSPMLVNLQAPFAGAGTEQSTGWIVAPLGFGGGALRINRFTTIGAGFYLTTAFGGRFSDVERIGDCSLPAADRMTCGDVDPPNGADQDLTFFVAEAAIPVAFNIRENLRVGVSLRLPFGIQIVDSYSQVGGGNYNRAEQRVMGVGIPGVLAGVQWDPIPQVSLSFVYRSKVRVPMHGHVDTSFGGAMLNDLHVRTHWYVPHMFRLGVAWRGLDDRLRLVAEGRIQLHKEANAEQVFHIDTGTALGTIDQHVPLGWRNAYVLSLGAEYLISERWPIRLGFSYGNSATPRARATPFTPPPNTAPGFYAGAGYHARTWSLDGSLGVSAGATTHIRTPYPGCSDTSLATPTGCDGWYGTKTLFGALTFEYTLGGEAYHFQRRARHDR